MSNKIEAAKKFLEVLEIDRPTAGQVIEELTNTVKFYLTDAEMDALLETELDIYMVELVDNLLNDDQKVRFNIIKRG